MGCRSAGFADRGGAGLRKALALDDFGDAPDPAQHDPVAGAFRQSRALAEGDDDRAGQGRA